MTSRRIAVVGGGMSGIATAWYLAQAGHRPVLFEAGSTLGGRAGSAMLGDRVVDIGGKNIGRRYHLFRSFIDAHGAPPLQYFGINSSTVVDGRLRTVDSQKKLASLIHILRLIGLKDTWRLAAMARRVRRAPEEALLGGPDFSKLAERCDHLPISAWFGDRTVQRLLRPIIVRMNGAEPDEYAFGNFGSNLKMITDRYDQLTDGMSSLLASLDARVEVSLDSRVTRLNAGSVAGARSGVVLEVESNEQRRNQRFDAAALALPAPLAAGLVPDENLAEALKQVAYHPVALAVVEYARPIFTREVRAVVFDAHSALSNAGCYGVHDLNVVRYTLSGRKSRQIDDTADPRRVIETAERELSKYVPVAAQDRRDFVYRRFERGLCAYTPYHHRLLAKISAFEAKNPNIALSGDYVYGASIESCFHAGRACASKLVCQLAHQRDSFGDHNSIDINLHPTSLAPAQATSSFVSELR